MRVTKQPHLDFNYLDTIQKINKMQGSPRYLSKENLPGNKNSYAINLPKDSILNNIPIKVRLIRAAELNPNINLGKLHNINRNSKTLKKDLEINKDVKIPQNKDNNDTSSLYSSSSKKEENKSNNESNKKNKKNENEELNETNTLSPKSGLNYNQSEIYKLKKLLISSKNNEKEKEKEKEKESESTLNTNNIKTNKFTSDNPLETEDNYEINTYNQT